MRQRRKFHVTQVLPIWTAGHTDTANLVFQMTLEKFGIVDISTYLRKMRIPIVISVIVCACIGASSYGITGLFLGGLLGLFAPVALLLLGVTLVMIVIYLAIYCFVWAVILCVLWWLLHS
jgi:hypothetical protein